MGVVYLSLTVFTVFTRMELLFLFLFSWFSRLGKHDAM
jgi:hypothetical protein